MPGKMGIYLMFGLGPDFVLTQANIKLEAAVYYAQDRRGDVESRFMTVCNEPLVIEGGR